MRINKKTYYLDFSADKSYQAVRRLILAFERTEVDKDALHKGILEILDKEHDYVFAMFGTFKQMFAATRSHDFATPEGWNQKISNDIPVIHSMWPSLNTMGFYRRKLRISEAVATLLAPALVAAVNKVKADVKAKVLS